jgi:hypothetical protein
MIAIASPARVAASKANGSRSRGPVTPEGKSVSRRNSLKTGHTGAGVVLTDEDALAVVARFKDLRDQFRPETPMGKILVYRVALHSIRLERSAEHEAASLSEKIRHAREDHDHQRFLEVEGLLAGLAATPATSVRRLLRTPEGTEALIRAWEDLRTVLERADLNCWTITHQERANHLMGRSTGEVTASRVDELSLAITGNFSLLWPSDGERLEPDQRRAWARELLVELVDQELKALRQCFDALDHDAFALDREEAPQRALFDDSKAAVLARRYEAANERGMFRSLNELRKVEAEAPSPVANVAPAYPEVPSGSFFPAPEPAEDDAFGPPTSGRFGSDRVGFGEDSAEVMVSPVPSVN